MEISVQSISNLLVITDILEIIEIIVIRYFGIKCTLSALVQCHDYASRQ